MQEKPGRKVSEGVKGPDIMLEKSTQISGKHDTNEGSGTVGGPKKWGLEME